jgi:hypothetical protein
VIALAYHVDYWDKLGWKDPFGSKSMTDAQAAYKAPLGIEGMYTPMFAINGAAHTPNPGEAQKRIVEERKAGKSATVTAKAVLADGVMNVEGWVQADEIGALELVLAVCENHLTTEIKAGELKGETMTEHGVVRHLTASGALAKERKTTFEVKPDAAWKTENCYVVVFVRVPDTRRILGATRLEWKDVKAERK